MGTDSIRFVETVADAEGATDVAIVVPCLRLMQKIEPLAEALSTLAGSGESISVWRPIHSWRKLKSIRSQFDLLTPRFREAIKTCHDRMGQPVERGSSIDNAWLQGYSTAIGTSALFQLQSAFQSVGEVLDRKAAYALAAFSLYVAVISMVLTVVFGWLSLPTSQPAQVTPTPAVERDAPQANVRPPASRPSP
jgi:hypothetical protein